MSTITQSPREAETGKLVPIKHRVLRQSVRETLEEAICDGRLASGSPMVEVAIASELTVSRASVREAMRELERQGLVINFPHRKTIVAPWTPRDVSEFASLRAVLEGLAARLATERNDRPLIADLSAIVKRMQAECRRRSLKALTELDLEFHDRLSAASGHSRLIRLLNDLKAQRRAIISANRAHFLFYPNLKDIPDAHEAIVEGLRARDGDLVARTIEQHVMEGARRLIRLLKV